MKFRMLPIEVEASQWFVNGDHPKDGSIMFIDQDGCQRLSEGRVVQYFRHFDRASTSACQYCGSAMREHGQLSMLEGGHVVCPGDWVVTGVKGENYPCKPDTFAATYVAASSNTAPLDGENWQEVVAHAYANLWAVSNQDTLSEVLVVSVKPEEAALEAALEARRLLRGLLTSEQRGKAIGAICAEPGEFIGDSHTEVLYVVMGAIGHGGFEPCAIGFSRNKAQGIDASTYVKEVPLINREVRNVRSI